ncbi:MAG: hypothetical protein HQL70_10355 [Magnetococcales bacterium]|nr:hypothetical protein [Magnetococcales bacterium]
MLPMHSGAISGVSNELQDRVSFQAAVREIRAGSALRVNAVSKAPANDLTDDVKRDDIDPDQRGRGSDNQTVSYDMVAEEVREEEAARQKNSQYEAESQAEAMEHKPPLGLDFTSPSVIVSRSAPSRKVAKLFLKAAADAGHNLSKDPSTPPPKKFEVRVDVTV